MIEFQQSDPSLESQWRAIVLFGKNTATYKFAFAKSLLNLVSKETIRIRLEDLALPYTDCMIEHLRDNDKQGTVVTSKYIDSCREFIAGRISKDDLHEVTMKYGFRYVVDAFQNVNGATIPQPFYEKDFGGKRKEIVITDNLLKLKESYHFNSFDLEVEARWKLVETAWNFSLNPKLLEVKYDRENELFFLDNNNMRRIDITSVRDALNGYQKGKCFYSFKDISVHSHHEDLCEVDHFFPHANKMAHEADGANINGVWNLVLADKSVNKNKSARVPDICYLNRLFNRNEFYVSSKHPLAETIINQTGTTLKQRASFLQRQYDIAKQASIHSWKPLVELIGSF